MPAPQDANRPEQFRRELGDAQSQPPVLEPTEARQAVKLGTMRYVLLASLVLAIIVMVVVGLIWHAAS
jgi:hypothetical protein